MRSFDLQGHRGARGLKPENTLVSFEAAVDAGVTTIETDVHLTADGVPVLVHDALLNGRFCRMLPESSVPPLSLRPLVCFLTLSQLRGYCADQNPDLERFPRQNGIVTPLARLIAEEKGQHPFSIPTLQDLIYLVKAYAGSQGARAGKTPAQQDRAGTLVLDLELKRIPFRPELMGDGYAGDGPRLLEKEVVAIIRAAGMVSQTRIRSFDHRCVRFVRDLEPDLKTSVLVASTTSINPVSLVKEAGADTYCPELEFLDEKQFRLLHREGIRVVPWTVNDPRDWHQLLSWGIDGVTTDHPDQLAEILAEQGIRF